MNTRSATPCRTLRKSPVRNSRFEFKSDPKPCRSCKRIVDYILDKDGQIIVKNGRKFKRVKAFAYLCNVCKYSILSSRSCKAYVETSFKPLPQGSQWFPLDPEEGPRVYCERLSYHIAKVFLADKCPPPSYFDPPLEIIESNPSIPSSRSSSTRGPPSMGSARPQNRQSVGRPRSQRNVAKVPKPKKPIELVLLDSDISDDEEIDDSPPEAESTEETFNLSDLDLDHCDDVECHCINPEDSDSDFRKMRSHLDLSTEVLKSMENLPSSSTTSQAPKVEGDIIYLGCKYSEKYLQKTFGINDVAEYDDSELKSALLRGFADEEKGGPRVKMRKQQGKISVVVSYSVGVQTDLESLKDEDYDYISSENELDEFESSESQSNGFSSPTSLNSACGISSPDIHEHLNSQFVNSPLFFNVDEVNMTIRDNNTKVLQNPNPSMKKMRDSSSQSEIAVLPPAKRLRYQQSCQIRLPTIPSFLNKQAEKRRQSSSASVCSTSSLSSNINDISLDSDSTIVLSNSDSEVASDISLNSKEQEMCRKASVSVNLPVVNLTKDVSGVTKSFLSPEHKRPLTRSSSSPKKDQSNCTELVNGTKNFQSSAVKSPIVTSTNLSRTRSKASASEKNVDKVESTTSGSLCLKEFRVKLSMLKGFGK